MKRLKIRSLRVRLTLWYSCALVLVMLILAGASRWALTASLDHALDQGLRHRLIGLHDFIEENREAAKEEFLQSAQEVIKILQEIEDKLFPTDQS